MMRRRICRDCPIPHCGAKSLVRLSGHLKNVHHLDSSERRKWLQECKLQRKEAVMVYNTELNEKSKLCFTCANEAYPRPGRSINRRSRDCPIPNCGSKYLVRLANHLRNVHHLDITERRKWLNESKRQHKEAVMASPANEAYPRTSRSNAKRETRDCPIPNCGSIDLTRLSNHLSGVHHLNRTQRKKWLQEAKLQRKIQLLKMRVYHKCPIQHCKAKYILNLSMHLRTVHKLDRIERRTWLKGKKTPKRAVKFYNHEPQVDEESELNPTCASEARVSRPPPVTSVRVCRDCPIPNCGSKYVVRLSNHLNRVHKLNATERKKWLKQAKLQGSY